MGLNVRRIAAAGLAGAALAATLTGLAMSLASLLSSQAAIPKGWALMTALLVGVPVFTIFFGFFAFFYWTIGLLVVGLPTLAVFRLVRLHSWVWAAIAGALETSAAFARIFINDHYLPDRAGMVPVMAVIGAATGALVWQIGFRPQHPLTPSSSATHPC